MPTHHDETLLERYQREHRDHERIAMSEHTPDQAVGSGRNHYYAGQFDAEEPADTAQRLRLVAERDSLRAVNAEMLEALKERDAKPCGHQFQARDGTWKEFMDERHYKNTVEDGTWPIREIFTAPPKAQPMTDAMFLERLLREGSQELVGLTTFVNHSIQGRGRVQLLASAAIIRDFIYRCHGIGD